MEVVEDFDENLENLFEDQPQPMDQDKEKRGREEESDDTKPKKPKAKEKITAAEMALEVAKDKKAAAALVEHTAPKQLEELPILGTATEGGSSSGTTTLAQRQSLKQRQSCQQHRCKARLRTPQPMRSCSSSRRMDSKCRWLEAAA